MILAHQSNGECHLVTLLKHWCAEGFKRVKCPKVPYLWAATITFLTFLSSTTFLGPRPEISGGWEASLPLKISPLVFGRKSDATFKGPPEASEGFLWSWSQDRQCSEQRPTTYGQSSATFNPPSPQPHTPSLDCSVGLSACKFFGSCRSGTAELSVYKSLACWGRS